MNQDTVNPDFARDPTIVGEFETLSAQLYQGHQYKKIMTEGMGLLPIDFIPDHLTSILDIPECTPHGYKEGIPKTQNSSLKGMKLVLDLLTDDGTYQTHNGATYTKSQLNELYSRLTSTETALIEYLSSFVYQFYEVYGVKRNTSPAPIAETPQHEGSAMPPMITMPSAFEDCYGITLCDDLDEFMEKYTVKLDDTLSAANMAKDKLFQEINIDTWLNFEFYKLPHEFKAKLYASTKQ